MNPYALGARVALYAALAAGAWWVWHSLIVTLPALEQRAEKAEQRADMLIGQRAALLAEQAHVVAKEADNAQKLAALADASAVSARLLRVCQSAVRAERVPAAADTAGGVASGDAEADVSGVADLGADVRASALDDLNHAALAERWCRLVKERGQVQPGCP